MQRNSEFNATRSFGPFVLAALIALSGGATFAGMTTQTTVDPTTDGLTDASSGSTSSTSDSSDGDDKKEQEKTARRFIQRNLDPLQTDIARGNGEHLQALLAIHGCRLNTSAALIGAVRGNFSEQLDQAQVMQSRAEVLHGIVLEGVRGEFAAACVA